MTLGEPLLLNTVPIASDKNDSVSVCPVLGITTDVSKVVTTDVSKVVTTDVSKVVTTDVSKVVTTDVSKVVTTDVSKVVTEVISRTIDSVGSFHNSTDPFKVPVMKI